MKFMSTIVDKIVKATQIYEKSSAQCRAMVLYEAFRLYVLVKPAKDVINTICVHIKDDNAFIRKLLLMELREQMLRLPHMRGHILETLMNRLFAETDSECLNEVAVGIRTYLLQGWAQEPYEKKLREALTAAILRMEKQDADSVYLATLHDVLERVPCGDDSA